MTDLTERMCEILRRPFKESDRPYVAKAKDEIMRLHGLLEQCAKMAESHVGACSGRCVDDGAITYDEACRDIAKAIRSLVNE